MGTVTTILLVLALFVAGFLIYVATRPNELAVRRTTRLRAAPDRIFAEVNDFHRWRNWSPWEKLDPELARDFSGSELGKGAVYAWKGNPKVGEGRMEILESTPPSEVKIQLDFIKPFPSSNITTFTLVPQGEFTELTWGMRGPAGFMTKLMCVFMDLDQAIGKDFEAGMENLRGLVEERPAAEG